MCKPPLKILSTIKMTYYDAARDHITNKTYASVGQEFLNADQDQQHAILQLILIHAKTKSVGTSLLTSLVKAITPEKTLSLLANVDIHTPETADNVAYFIILLLHYHLEITDVNKHILLPTIHLLVHPAKQTNDYINTTTHYTDAYIQASTAVLQLIHKFNLNLAEYKNATSLVSIHEPRRWPIAFFLYLFALKIPADYINICAHIDSIQLYYQLPSNEHRTKVIELLLVNTPVSSHILSTIFDGPALTPSDTATRQAIADALLTQFNDTLILNVEHTSIFNLLFYPNAGPSLITPNLKKSITRPHQFALLCLKHLVHEPARIQTSADVIHELVKHQFISLNSVTTYLTLTNSPTSLALLPK